MTQKSRAHQTDSVPLAVDLDGTLHAGDLGTLLALRAVRTKPIHALRLGAMLPYRGLAGIAKRLDETVKWSPAELTWHADVLDYARTERDRGRRLILATGAPQAAAERCNAHLGGLFDAVVGSTGVRRCVGHVKAARLIQLCGSRGFDYIGNSRQDIPVWAAARFALVAYADDLLFEKVAGCFEVSERFPSLAHGSGAWRVQNGGSS